MGETMKYVPQGKLAQWRKEHTPPADPVSGQPIANPAVDHDHGTGMIRGVLDSEINAWEGRIYNAHKKLSPRVKALTYPEMLQALVGYLKRKETVFLHPTGAIQLYKRFGRMKKDEQIEILEGLRQAGKKVTTEEILACANSKERVALYRKLLMIDRYE